MTLLLTFLVSFVSALILHPKVVEVAKLKNITDCPSRRKLQREPVPVLGGVVVFFGILMGIGIASFSVWYQGFALYIAMMTLMLCIGTLDDITDLSTSIRFAVEIGATLCLIFLGGIEIDNFFGLWGVHQIPFWLSVILTIITVVGIINAINLVDGVDGLSSGYCIMACAVFAWYFHITGNVAMASYATAAIGALIPFFVFNVFGKRSKMFIGDGGTLLMGVVLSIMVLRILTSPEIYPTSSLGTTIVNTPTLDINPINPHATTELHFGLIPFTLAVLSFPLCDTLRVLFTRIIRGKAPFAADTSHLHHALIAFGFSHLKTTAAILCLNAFIIFLWNILYFTGCSVDAQFYAIVGTTIFLNLTVYYTASTFAKNTRSLK